ncbi:MAG: DMT family transporter [Pseudomonadota bacterium]
MQSVKPTALSFNSAFGVLFLSGIIMGFSPVFVREAEVGAFASAFWRVAFALPLLGVWVWLETRNTSENQTLSFSRSSVLAGLFFAGDLVFWHLSILNTTMANATFTVCTSVVWVALFSNLTLRERISRPAWLGIIMCLAGLALLMQGTLQIAPERLIGDIYGLITSVFLGLYMLAMRSARRTTKSGSLFLSSTLVTGAVLLVVMLVSGDTIMAQSASGWFSLFSLGAFTHVAGQGLVTIAIGSLSAMFSSLVIFIEALAAALFGWWLFDEGMSFIQMIGGLLILAGVWMAKPSK